MFTQNLLRVLRGYAFPVEYAVNSPTIPYQVPPHETIKPRVSVLIPTRDRIELLAPCISSVLDLTVYRDFEILVIDNGSRADASLEYFEKLRNQGVRVYRVDEKFNYSKLMNFAATEASGEILVFLNNDTLVLNGDWLDSFAAYLEDENVGVVGARLWKPDGSLQHGGIAIGLNGLAIHPFAGKTRPEIDKLFKGQATYEVSAATFACVGVRAKTFSELNGLDEKFPVGLNDVDFCLRVGALGKKIIISAAVNLVHEESKSRRNPRKNFLGIIQSFKDVTRFLFIYRNSSLKDPFFTAN